MANKQYGPAKNYESKLVRVMERLGVKEYDYNFDRHGCWVEFRYRNEPYRFDHSVAKAKARGVNITYGSDAFSQVVLINGPFPRPRRRHARTLSARRGSIF